MRNAETSVFAVPSWTGRCKRLAGISTRVHRCAGPARTRFVVRGADGWECASLRVALTNTRARNAVRTSVHTKPIQREIALALIVLAVSGGPHRTGARPCPRIIHIREVDASTFLFALLNTNPPEMYLSMELPSAAYYFRIDGELGVITRAFTPEDALYIAVVVKDRRSVERRPYGVYCQVIFESNACS